MKTFRAGNTEGSQKQYNKGFVKACRLYDVHGQAAHVLVNNLINNHRDNMAYLHGANDASRFYAGIKLG